MGLCLPALPLPPAVTLAMEQPASLQVDYVFRGVEHSVRVGVSGQVLELEVEDRMTADQWRGEFDASCEYACLGGVGGISSYFTLWLWRPGSDLGGKEGKKGPPEGTLPTTQSSRI